MRRHTETANEPKPRLASPKVAAETVAGPPPHPPAGHTFQSGFFIVLLDSVIQRDFSRVECRCIVSLRFGHGIVLPFYHCKTLFFPISSSFSNFHCLHLASPHSFALLSTVTTVTETKISAMWRILCQFLVVFLATCFSGRNSSGLETLKIVGEQKLELELQLIFFLFYFLFRFPFAVLHGERSGQSGAVHHQHGRHS